jgi:hypothetical protein
MQIYQEQSWKGKIIFFFWGLNIFILNICIQNPYLVVLMMVVYVVMVFGVVVVYMVKMQQE